MNKPGSYIVRDRDLTRAYLYSTMVDLHSVVGQYVTLVVSDRPNNDFAFLHTSLWKCNKHPS